METNQAETKIELPKGFLLGFASSAHQAEGDNYNNDWWHWEQEGKLPKSGKACDHYNRYDEDYAIAKEIGLNAARVSIEWSRVEPLEGKWDSIAIEHYRKQLKKLKELGFVRMVTLHHFTLPWWLAEKKGFETNQGTEAFARFCWFIAKNLGDEIDLWCTINEPDVYTLMGYIRGIWPPFKKNPVMAFTVYSNLVEAHKAAYRAIKQACPDAKIGLAKNNVYYEPYRNNNPFDKFAACIHKYVGNTYFLNRVKKHVDFFGLNYYFFDLIKFDLKKFSINLDYSEEYRRNNPTQPRSDMGWRIYPKGLYHLLADLKAYGKPIYITENGIANARDDMRKDFVRQHLEWISKAIKEGADVRGYFYWSLTDNFEWQDGFDRYFGLVEINYSTQERKVRESAKVFKEILS